MLISLRVTALQSKLLLRRELRNNMRSVIFILLIIFSHSGCGKKDGSPKRSSKVLSAGQIGLTIQSEENNIQGPDEVYICKSAGARRYHLNESCRGLRQCQHKIEKMTIKKAEAIGLTLCKLED
jgi:hypothetical protein